MARQAEAVRDVEVDPGEQALHEYLSLKTEADALTARMKELKDDVVSYIESHTEPDDSGHRLIAFDEPIAGFAGFQHQRRVKRTPDLDAAVQLLDGLGLTERCIKLVPTINEDEVMGALYEDLITEEQVDAMYPQTITYALVPKRKV